MKVQDSAAVLDTGVPVANTTPLPPFRCRTDWTLR